MTMRIATFNINGIRAAQRRGFEKWLRERDPDVVALQELRAPASAIPEGVFGDHHLTYEQGTLPGRNGVAILTRKEPSAVRTWSGTALLRHPSDDHIETVELDPAPLARGLREFADQAATSRSTSRTHRSRWRRCICRRAACPLTCRSPDGCGRHRTVAHATTARCASSTRSPVSSRDPGAQLARRAGSCY